MNILYLASRQHFLGTHAGFSHSFNITRALVKKGNKVTLLIGRPKTHTSQKLSTSFSFNENFTIHFVDWQMYRNFISYFKAMKDLKRMVKDADIIHERYELHGNVATFYAKMRRKPSVLEANSPFVEEFFKKGSPLFYLFSWLRRINFKMAGRVVVQTPQLKEMFSHTIYPERIRVVTNGADPELLNPATIPDIRKEMERRKKEELKKEIYKWLKFFIKKWFFNKNIENGHPFSEMLFSTVSDKDVEQLLTYCRAVKGREVVLFVGSFRYWHGVVDLVNCFPQIVKERKKIKLVLIGEGELFGKVKERVRNYQRKGLIPENSVILTSQVSYLLLPLYLKTADVCTAPFNFLSRYEKGKINLFKLYDMWWSPLKIFEYMAMEKPIVAPEVGSVPLYLGKDCGLTYPHGDKNALASAILFFFENKSQAVKTGKKAREKVIAEYSWEKKAVELMEIYKEILRER